MTGAIRATPEYFPHAMGIQIPESELVFRATRAGGPGGQHVNTSATRVEVRWPFEESPVLTAEQRERIRRKLGNRIDATGALRIAIGTRRSQGQNRAAAIERLEELVEGALYTHPPRKQTKTPRGAKEARLAEKKRRSERKASRRFDPLED